MKRLNFRILFCISLLFPAAFLNAASIRDFSRSDNPANGVQNAAQTMFTDSAGRTVQIPAKITRVSPSGGTAQMFLLAIAPDLLCTIAAPYTAAQAEFIPPYLLTLPVAGQFYGSRDINLEEIAAIGPEIVIDAGEFKRTIVRDMDAITTSIAVPAVHITADLYSTPQAFRTLGKLLGREEKGEVLAAFCEKALSNSKEIMAKAGNHKKSILYCQGAQGLSVLAAGTFHTEILDSLADNRAVTANPSSRGSGNETDMEQISLWDPEVILIGPNSVYKTAATDPAWRQLRAVKSGAYYEVPNGPYNWMGSPSSINRFIGMIWLEKILYPEYADFDLYDETAEYYKLFYDFELSRERFHRLTANSIRE
ncbi:MAG: ABC transporter substrate-binding protein [Treponema sp.]|jgi:iron complex transport system substrate-binding protein|nr:ABC transporter substrate-binding protein [Treponema sp.]